MTYNVFTGTLNPTQSTNPYTRDKWALPWQPIWGLKLQWMHLYERQRECGYL